nr:hypothetical protein [Tanacetum cinerariifolium]
MLYGSFLIISRIPLFLLIFTRLEMKIPSLTQASPLIVFARLSLVYLIGVELSRNSILTLSSIPGNLKTLAKGCYPLRLHVPSFNWESIEEIEDDNLCEKLLNVHLLIANIKALKDNPTQSSEFSTKSSSTSLNSLLEETSTFHNSLPKFENFYFDLGEISSGSTTTHCDISLPDYEAFYFDDDHVKEISSGSTTTYFDISLSEYDSFIFDLTHEEFVDELAHIISPPEYDRFYFWNLPDPGELIKIKRHVLMRRKKADKRTRGTKAMVGSSELRLLIR